MSTFVSVGNARQPFARLINAVSRLAATLPQPVIIQHGHTPMAAGTYERIAFLEMDEFRNCMESAELLILHAGAGSVLQALQFGKKPVVVPRRGIFGEHVNDHQAEFASALADENRIFLVKNIEELGKVVNQAMGWKKREKPPADAGANMRHEPHMLGLIREVFLQYNRLYSR